MLDTLDFWLIFVIITASIVCTTFGFFLGVVFASKPEKIEPCESLEDILKREG